MECNDNAIKTVIRKLNSYEFGCPEDFGLKARSNECSYGVVAGECTDCWIKALQTKPIERNNDNG